MECYKKKDQAHSNRVEWWYPGAQKWGNGINCNCQLYFNKTEIKLKKKSQTTDN